MTICEAQEIILKGVVLDLKTKQPLINASVGLVGIAHGTITDSDGHFELFISTRSLNDTLFVSYVGYLTVKKKVAEINSSSEISFALTEVATVLDEVKILAKRMYKFEHKKTESSMKLVKGNLYAGETEVTNEQYNQFLNYLIQSNQKNLYEKYKPDIRKYEGPMLTFFKGYHLPYQESKETKYSIDYDKYPIVNISHEAAEAYCEWLSSQYNNEEGKKKFSKVVFRLPTLKEWQIAALGYKKFQSWNIEENEVEVGIPKIPGEMIPNKKIMMAVKGNDILYPWYGAHDYRNRAQNNKNCWMGNFKIPEESVSCFLQKPGGDGYLLTGKVASYFSNGMGLYDVVGNVEEMINEKGKACGGSWDHSPEESTMMSIHEYSEPAGNLGFRVFMEVVE